ncbi:MAG: winged helix-turn-helix domain-containing protein [Lewinellaceae bacterium]|nr:winged helix-turn-helix domain-containing protein [Lewinellaceae bacterium]
MAAGKSPDVWFPCDRDHPQQIAAEIGTTREVVTRILRKLEKTTCSAPAEKNTACVTRGTEFHFN